MTVTVINLPLVGDITEAWIMLTTKTLDTAVSVNGDTLSNVECIEIEGFIQHATWSWRGQDIADMVLNYPDHPDVQAIVPLWQRWGMHSQKRRTLDDQVAFDAALAADIFPYHAVAAVDEKTGNVVVAHQDAQLDPALDFKPVAVAGSTDVFVEPLDDGVLDQIKAAFGVQVDPIDITPLPITEPPISEPPT